QSGSQLDHPASEARRRQANQSFNRCVACRIRSTAARDGADCGGSARLNRGRSAPWGDDDHDTLAFVGRRRLRRVAARLAAVIRIEAIWLATEPLDMRAGTETILARVVKVFGS